jgi:hypothetical protein
MSGNITTPSQRQSCWQLMQGATKNHVGNASGYVGGNFLLRAIFFLKVFNKIVTARFWQMEAPIVIHTHNGVWFLGKFWL